jgi:hypothetical protein
MRGVIPFELKHEDVHENGCICNALPVSSVCSS